MCLLDITQTAIRGELFRPIWYFLTPSHYALIASGGLIVRRRGYDRFFAWYLHHTMYRGTRRATILDRRCDRANGANS